MAVNRIRKQLASASIIALLALMPASLLAESRDNAEAELLRTRATGIEVAGEHDSYRLVPEGVVAVDSAASPVNAEWRRQLGRYQLSLGGEPRKEQRNLPSSPYQMAYNPRTGKPAVVTGKIVTWLQPGTSAATVAQRCGLQVAADFPHLGVAYLELSGSTSLPDAIARVAADPAVKRSYPEIIENVRKPR